VGLSWLAAALASAVVATPPVASRDPAPIELHPLTDWSTSRLDDGCIISRTFGDPASPTRVELRNYDPWDGGFNVAISGPLFIGQPSAFRAGWLPGGRFIEVDTPTFEQAPDGTEVVLFHHGLWNAAIFGMSSKEWDAYYENDGPQRYRQAIRGFSLTGVSGKSIAILTGAMDTVIEERDRCIHEMLAARGVDPADENRDDSRVRLKDRENLTQQLLADVPEVIRSRKRKTFVDFLLYIDEKGEPSHCRLLALPYDAAYESRGCGRLMSKARFEFKRGESAQPAFFKIGGYFIPAGAS